MTMMVARETRADPPIVRYIGQFWAVMVIFSPGAPELRSGSPQAQIWGQRRAAECKLHPLSALGHKLQPYRVRRAHRGIRRIFWPQE